MPFHCCFCRSLFLILDLSEGRTEKNDLSLKNITGSISSLRETSYTADIDSCEGNKFIISRIHITRYNEEGNVTEEIEQNHDGIVISRFTYEYDKNGNLIVKQSYNSEGTIKDRNCYSYNAFGNIIEDK
jgi:hypothetical protein